MHASDLLTSPLLTGAGAPPRQRQLIQRLKQAILAGRLPAGDRLPASRALAEDLGVSRNTVLIAYEQLAAEGYVVADRQGTRVAAVSTHSTAAAEAAAKKLLGWVASAGFKPEGSPIFAYYDPPWTLWFLRRNEVLVRLHQAD